MTAMSDKLAALVGEAITSRKTIYEHLENALKKNPHDRAVVVMHQPSGHLAELHNSTDSNPPEDCLTWTYDQLHQASLRTAVGLAQRGVDTGATIVTFMPNGVEYAVLMWVSAMLKVTLACLDPGAVSDARSLELQNLLRTLRPDVVVVASIKGLKAVNAALDLASMKQPHIKISLDVEATEKDLGDWTTLPRLVLDGGYRDVDEKYLLKDACNDDDDRCALIAFTSGTSSGKPKGVPRHFASITQGMEHEPWDRHGIKGNPPVFLLPTPNFRVIAPTLSLVTWKTGGTVVMPSPPMGFNARGVLDAIKYAGVNTLLLIPVMLHLLTADPSFSSRNLDSLGAVMIGADVITRQILTKTSEAFPHCHISCACGMTEIGMCVQWPFHGRPVQELPYFGDICPIGIPAPGVMLQIWDVDAKVIKKRGEPGELCYSGEGILKQYLGGVSAECFFSDDAERRWFRTGDLGLVNSGGIVYILGRIKDVVKRGGLAIAPAALESCIKELTGSETCVVAVAHAQLGQEPFAVVKDRCGETDDEIRAYVVAKFGKDYALAGVAELRQLGLEDFPRNATAKIEKFELEKRVQKMITGT